MYPVKRTTKYLGLLSDVSFKRHLFTRATPNQQISRATLTHFAGQNDQISTRKFLILLNGAAVVPPIDDIISQIVQSADPGSETPFGSQFWQGILDSITQSVADVYEVASSDLRPIPEDIRFLLDEEQLRKGICDHDRGVASGEFTLGIEGLVPWPMPDPDLVFSWELVIQATNEWKTILFEFTLNFEQVEGPGLAAVLGIIAYLASGNILGAISGLAVGHGIDLVYESEEHQSVAIKAIRGAYDVFDEFFDLFFENIGITASRPTEKSYKISMSVDHTHGDELRVVKELFCLGWNLAS